MNGMQRIAALYAQANQALAQWSGIELNPLTMGFGIKGDGIADDTAAIQRLFDNANHGDVFNFPRKDYVISAQIAINKSICVKGSWNRTKSGGSTAYGTRFIVRDATAQAAMESAFLVNSQSVKLSGFAVLGKTTASGVGVLFKTSNESQAEDLFVQNFNKGVKMGAGSAHVYLRKSIVTACYDTVYFGAGNLFDFKFEDCSFDGAIHAALSLEANTSVENVKVDRCQLGYNTQYAVFQEPTTTGDGYSLLTLKESPAEQIQVQHIRMYNGGNIHVEGGYYTWAAGYQPANSIFKIDHVNVGPIWFSPKLEPSYPNPNSPSVIEIPGYSNFDVHVYGDLNDNAQKWFNYGASLDMRKLFVNEMPFADQNFIAKNINIDTANVDQDIFKFKPLVPGTFYFDISVKTPSTCDVTVTIFFNDGNGARTQVLLPQYTAGSGPAVTLPAGHYSYPSYFAYCTLFNDMRVTVKSTVAGVKVSAKITEAM